MFPLKNHAGAMLATVPLLLAMASTATASDEVRALNNQGQNPAPLFLTATNGPTNFLAVINTRTKEVDYVPTGGSGGASGNAGGVAVAGNLAAVVNFGSTNVTIFVRRGNAMQPAQVIKTASQPVSVAFGHNHLLVLGLTTAESFPVYGNSVGTNADGSSPLMKGDKSAAQIVAFDGGVMYSEKSGFVSTLNLSAAVIGSGLSGPNRPVTLPTSPNNDTPFGMIGRGANVYLTIAHSDLEVLVVNNQIISMAAGSGPFKDQAGNITRAPCWNTLSGQFLFAADSPGKQLLRYLVSDASVFFDKSGVAKLSGSPTDLAADGSLLGVIDGGDGTNSNVSLFNIDSEGELTLRFAVRVAAGINGAAIMR